MAGKKKSAAPPVSAQPRTRAPVDRENARKFPACYACAKRQVRCSNTSHHTGFPCDHCVRRNESEDCISHLEHPDWVPGVSGATNKSRKRKAKAIEDDRINNHPPTKKDSRKVQDDDEKLPELSTNSPAPAAHLEKSASYNAKLEAEIAIGKYSRNDSPSSDDMAAGEIHLTTSSFKEASSVFGQAAGAFVSGSEGFDPNTPPSSVVGTSWWTQTEEAWIPMRAYLEE